MRRHAGTLLAWPQLPQRSFRERALVQSTAGFPGLSVVGEGARVYLDRALAQQSLDRLALAHLQNDLSYGALSEQDASGFAELLRYGDLLSSTRALKGQVLGPISSAAQLTDERQRPLIYDEQFLDALVQHVRLRAMWQEARLAEINTTTIICLDEPFLDIIGLPFLPIGWDDVCAWINETFDGIIGCKGIFASGSVDWSQVLRTSVELIVADVYWYSPALLDAAAAIEAFLDRDGVVGFGIIPAETDELAQVTAKGLERRIAVLLGSLQVAGIDPERLLRQAVISTTGPLGRLDASSAERALVLVEELSGLLRERYGLE